MKERGQLAWETYRNGGLDPWAHVERQIRNAALREAAEVARHQPDISPAGSMNAAREGVMALNTAAAILALIEEPR